MTSKQLPQIDFWSLPLLSHVATLHRAGIGIISTGVMWFFFIQDLSPGSAPTDVMALSEFGIMLEKD